MTSQAIERAYVCIMLLFYEESEFQMAVALLLNLCNTILLDIKFKKKLLKLMI